MSRLPGVLGEIAHIAGAPAAIALAERAGGQRVYIPARVSGDHWLVDCVGRDAAERICAHFRLNGRGGQQIDVPLASAGAYAQLRRRIARDIHKLDREGHSAREIARRVGVSQRTVHQHRAVHHGRRAGDQGRLI